jgi:hypothetical protein
VNAELAVFFVVSCTFLHPLKGLGYDEMNIFLKACKIKSALSDTGAAVGFHFLGRLFGEKFCLILF